MAITKEHRQESLSLAYVQAVAGASGMTCSFRWLDYGVDVTLHHIIERFGILCESTLRLDLQVKSTTNALFTEDEFKYDLDVRNYHLLREPSPNWPRLLVVLALPDVEQDWLEVSQEALVMRRCMYWISLAGAKPTQNKRTVRIALPRTNVFSIEFLTDFANRFRSRDPEK